MLKGFVSGEEKDIKRIPMKGKNLFDKDATTVYDAYFNESGYWLLSSDSKSIKVPCLPNTQYTLSVPNDLAVFRIYESADTGIEPTASSVNRATTITRNANIRLYTFTTSPTAKVLLFQGSSGMVEEWFNGLMLNLGSTALPYEPYGYQEGWEVRDSQDRLIWGREDELQTATGTLPFKGYALPVKVKSLLGNAVQNGTPAPDNIITPEMCGKLVGSDWTIPLTNAGQTIPVYLGEVPTVRKVKKLVLDGTEAWEWVLSGTGTYARMTVGQLNSVVQNAVISSHFEQNEIMSSTTIVGVDVRNVTSQNAATLNIRPDNVTTQTLASFTSYLASEYAAGHPVTVWYALTNEQTGIVNEPLCKISTYADELTTIQVHGLSAPLYGIGDYKDTLNLSTGVVTRKVKKMVLTGEEGEWKASQTRTGSFYLNVGRNGITEQSICDRATNVRVLDDYHYGNTFVEKSGSAILVNLWLFDTAITLSDFKSYLAAQYANGTPVTIWYTLETPTTETVTVPTGMTGEIEGYLTQVSTPTPTNRSVPKWNGVEESGGTYAVTVYTPPEIPTTTGQNTLTVDSNLAPSKLEVSIHAKKIHYGFKIDKSNDDSESAVIYTHDAVTMTPAHMDFTNDRFDYGSWGNAFFVRDCYPVALNLDGTEAYRLDPNDYTKKLDGTPSDIFYELLTEEPSDWSTQWKQYYTKSGDEYILNSQSEAPTFATDTYYKLTYSSSFTGNFMMAFPKVWFYRHEDSQYNYIEISDHKLSDDWKCYAHINTSGQEVDFIYLPLFKGVIVDSKLRSIPGQIPQGGTSGTTEVNAATALGSRWQIWDHSSAECLNDLLTLMSKSIDSQGRFGRGRESGYDSTDTVTYGELQTGTLIKSGKFHGFSSGYKEVKVFGIEGFWANRWDRLQGMLLVNDVWKIKMTPPYNFTGTDFVTLSNAEVPTGNGYLSKVQTSEYGSIPASIANGSSTKYFKDYFYKTATGTRVALRGGSCNSGGYAGFRCVYVRSAASLSGLDIGASPVYK